MSLSLTCYTVGPLAENCYLLADDVAKTAVLVDPGEEGDRLLEALERETLSLKEIWLTHAHFDHIGALADIVEVYPVPVRLHPADKPLYEHAAQAAQLWALPFRQPQTPTQDIADGQVIHFAGADVQCLFTPGHAPGHVAFYLPSEGYVIAGDALFRGSIGRTDLPMGNAAQLLESIQTRLFGLPEDTLVYPGHGPETSVGLEKRTNPFFTSA